MTKDTRRVLSGISSLSATLTREDGWVLANEESVSPQSRRSCSSLRMRISMIGDWTDINQVPMKLGDRQNSIVILNGPESLLESVDRSMLRGLAEYSVHCPETVQSPVLSMSMAAHMQTLS